MQKSYDFDSYFRKFIRDSRTGRRLQPSGRKLTAGTIANYQFTRSLILSFSDTKEFKLRILSARKLTARQNISEKRYWNRFYNRFSAYLHDEKGYSDNYVGVTIKNLKCFMNYLNRDLALGIGDFHKSFHVRKEEVPIYPLTPEQLQFLISDGVFHSSLSKMMLEVRDFFIFGCTVALRFSDLSALRSGNVQYINGQAHLAVKSIKTGSATLVRLPPYAVQIIDRYKKGRRLLPKFNVTNLNKYIKLLLEKAGFTQPVEVVRSKRGRPFNGSGKGSVVRFSDLATTHTMRRTAITTMLSLGVPEQVVRKISGHSPLSAANKFTVPSADIAFHNILPAWVYSFRRCPATPSFSSTI